MPPLARSTPCPSSSTATTYTTPSLHTLLLLASTFLLQLDFTHALPHPAPHPTTSINPSTNLPSPPYPPTYADHVLQQQDRRRPKVARPFGHPGAASVPFLLPDAAHVAAAAGAARAAPHAQGGARGPARRVILTRKLTRTVTLPVLAAHATTAAATIAAATVTSVETQQEEEDEEEEEEGKESELPPPIMPPTPTFLLLEGPAETLLLDASATATATPIDLSIALEGADDDYEESSELQLGDKEDIPGASQWLYEGDLETAEDITGLVPVVVPSPSEDADRHREQQFLELGGITSGGEGGHSPERKEMGRGTGRAISSNNAGGAAGGGAPKAVTTEREEIDTINENGSGGDDNNNSSSWRLWKDEV